MSAIDRATIAEVARNRLNLPANEAPRLEALIDNALKSLAKKVARRGDRALLVSEILKTPSAGEIDLSHVDFTAVLVDTYRVEGAIKTQAETTKVFWHVSSIAKLRATSVVDADAIWYHLEDRALIFKNPTDGLLNTFATPVKLAGSYIPTLPQLPDVLDDELIVEVVVLGQAKTDGVNLNIGTQE